jgi:hypothetical protein
MALAHRKKKRQTIQKRDLLRGKALVAGARPRMD